TGAAAEPTLAAGVTELQALGLKVDYLELRRQFSLQPASAEDRDLVLLVAAYLGQTRLIDNLSFRRRT
ncbi:pantoate--beta-alanine ligase, partial [Pseudomonas oryzihabitans]